MRIYCDANVYLDYLLDRKSRTGEPLGLYAKWVFDYARECHYKILFSDHVRTEIVSNIPKPKTFYRLLDKLRPKIVEIRTTDEDRKKARELDPTNTSDALHAVLAKKHSAHALVTSNYADFVNYMQFLGPTQLIQPMNIATIIPSQRP